MFCCDKIAAANLKVRYCLMHFLNYCMTHTNDKEFMTTSSQQCEISRYLALDLQHLCVPVIKYNIFHPKPPPCHMIQNQKLKLKARRPNFANVSNEKTRVPLEAMSLKIRDLKRCGQVIL